MISESQMINENADFSCGINREQAPNGDTYLCFKKFKDRNAKGMSVTANDYFVHPFESGMRLKEDYGTDEYFSLDFMTDILGQRLHDEDSEDEIIIGEDGRPTTKEIPKDRSKRAKRAFASIDDAME